MRRLLATGVLTIATLLIFPQANGAEGRVSQAAPISVDAARVANYSRSAPSTAVSFKDLRLWGDDSLNECHNRFGVRRFEDHIDEPLRDGSIENIRPGG